MFLLILICAIESLCCCVNNTNLELEVLIARKITHFSLQSNFMELSCLLNEIMSVKLLYKYEAYKNEIHF